MSSYFLLLCVIVVIVNVNSLSQPAWPESFSKIMNVTAATALASSSPNNLKNSINIPHLEATDGFYHFKWYDNIGCTGNVIDYITARINVCDKSLYGGFGSIIDNGGIYYFAMSGPDPTCVNKNPVMALGNVNVCSDLPEGQTGSFFGVKMTSTYEVPAETFNAYYI